MEQTVNTTHTSSIPPSVYQHSSSVSCDEDKANSSHNLSKAVSAEEEEEWLAVDKEQITSESELSENDWKYENKGQTKADDDRVVNDVEKFHRFAADISKSDEADEKQGPTGKLQMLLEHGESFVRYILAQSRFGSLETSSDNFKRKSFNEKDDEELLKETEEEIQGHKLFTRLTTQPSILKGQAKGYQMEGLNWLIYLYESGLNGILADEMGLGKTFMSISLLAYLREFRNINGPHLVLAPKSTLGNWVNEFRKFCPSIDVFELLGTKEERAEMKLNDLVPGTHDVIICSYEMCVKERAILRKFSWRYIIIDEAHRIKNAASKLSSTVRQFHTQFRLLLTGTPLQNNLKELWALLNFLFPEVFTSSTEFEEIFDLTGPSVDGLSADDRESRNMYIVSRLHKLLKPFLLRRVKREVMFEMPPKKEFWLYVSLTELQRKLYKDVLSRSLKAFDGGDSSGRAQLLNVAMQLRKAANHPYLFDGYEDKTLDPMGEHVIENSGKLKLLDKLLHRLAERGSRTLIFSQMTRMIDILEDYCRIRDLLYFRIDGNTAGEDRDRQIEEFNSEGCKIRIFLLSTRAGGLGINLASADTVILYDSDWNPQVDLQAMDRAHRIGQKRPVNVYRLIQEGTIEEMIIEKALLKLQLDTAVIQHGRLNDKKKQISKIELMSMVQFGADHIFKSGKSDITEDDLDAILARGEERSNLINSKMSEHIKKSILDFSVNPNTNLYEYEGIDYNQEQRKADRETWARLASQDTSVNRVERIARQRVRIAKEQDLELTRGNRSFSRIVRLPPMHEWQFYDKTQILKLHELEFDNLRPGNSNEKFSDEHRQLKQNLLKAGFSDWSKRDFLAFIRGNELFGRENIQLIAKEIGDSKNIEEIRRYSEVFWRRYSELSDWEKWLRKIQTGEMAIQKRKAMEEVIIKKQFQYKYPWKEMQVCMASNKGKITFTEEEDRWMLNLTSLLGHGQWDKMKQLLLHDTQFDFDWAFRCRQTSDLGKRVDALIKSVKKEESKDETIKPKAKRTRDSQDEAIKTEKLNEDNKGDQSQSSENNQNSDGHTEISEPINKKLRVTAKA